MQRVNLTTWLKESVGDLFEDFDSINGNVIKPAGAPNGNFVRFGAMHKVDGIRAQITIEEGGRRGQMHAHVVLEVCHHYTDRNKYGLTGVHVNRQGIINHMNGRIPNMPVPNNEKPDNIYVNVRLLTKQTDNSSKWLALSYINKDVDAAGRDLAADRLNADQDLQDIHRSFRERGEDLIDENC